MAMVQRHIPSSLVGEAVRQRGGKASLKGDSSESATGDLVTCDVDPYSLIAESCSPSEPVNEMRHPPFEN